MKTITMLTTLAALSLTGLVGCNVSTTGTEGKVAFTPDECGRISGCNFADHVGVGGILSVHVSGLEGFSTIGIDVESSDPEVMLVTPTADVGGQATWKLTGLAPGPVSLLALDAEGVTVDYIDVDVVQPERLIMQNPIGEAVGPVADQPDYDEHWFVDADQRVVFHVTPVIDADQEVMGEYEYAAVVDVGLTEVINQPDLLSKGQLDMTPTTPGQYEVIFNDNYGNGIAVLIDVQGQ